MTRNEALQDEVIDQWIQENKENYVHDVIKLINIKSVSHEEKTNTPFGSGCAEVLDTALTMMKNFGFKTRNEKYYGIASKSETRSDKKLGIFLHLDVVPEGTGWTYSPYDATIDKGFLIGRGVGDNKGPAVAVMYALKYLEDNHLLNNTVYQYFGLAEETGMSDIAHFLQDNSEPDIGIVADVTFPVVYGEKGIIEACYTKHIPFQTIASLHVGTASNIVPPLAEIVLNNSEGRNIKQLFATHKHIRVEEEGTKVKLIATGISKHAAYPDGSLNAGKVLFDALLSTDLLRPEEKKEISFINSTMMDCHGKSIHVPLEDKLSGKISHILGMIRMQENTIEVHYNLRYPVTSKGKEIQEAMHLFFKQQGYKQEQFHNSNPSLIDPHSPVVQHLTHISNQILNQNGKPYIIGGGTYSRKLQNGIAYGIFDPQVKRLFDDNWGGAHQPDESVFLEMFYTGIKIYIHAFAYLDQYLSEQGTHSSHNQ